MAGVIRRLIERLLGRSRGRRATPPRRARRRPQVSRPTTPEVEVVPRPAPAPVPPPPVAAPSAEPPRPPTELGPDAFPCPLDHPRRVAHEVLQRYVEAAGGVPSHRLFEIGEFGAGVDLLAQKGRPAVDLHVAASERWVHVRSLSSEALEYRVASGVRRACESVVEALDRRRLPREPEDLVLLLRCRIASSYYSSAISASLVRCVEWCAEKHAVDGALREALVEYRDHVGSALPDPRQRAVLERLGALLGEEAQLELDGRVPWGAAVTEFLERSDEATRDAWVALIRHAQTAKAGKPSKKWARTAQELLEPLVAIDVAERLIDWFPRVDATSADGQFHGLDSELAKDTLKGLCWVAGLVPVNRELARSLGALTRASLRKQPYVGPRARKVANAAIHALGQFEGEAGMTELAVLLSRVKFKPAVKGIEKALDVVAQREGIPRDEIDELAIPTYGLDEVGRRTDELGEFRAELVVVGTGKAELRWSRGLADGTRKTQKSVPAAVKREHADDLKELRAAAKDVVRMLGAQRDRLDSLYLADRTWSVPAWRERYLDHPVVGVLARRLLWTVEVGDDRVVVGWANDALRTLDDEEFAEVSVDARVRLWHPVDATEDELLAWRDWLERHGIVQPFKQAHREVYRLTDAERNTRIYSNRFAGHVLRQHQFQALARTRRWDSSLRMMVEDEYAPPSRTLAPWSLYAEYWVEGAGEDYGHDTNEAGAFLRLTTDQVRFYPIDAPRRSAHACGGGYSDGARAVEAVELERIPALVLSEVLRDVDLFVGVASLGNDPAWLDGGREVRYREYWHQYAFGELAETANTRRAILAALVPRLAIADRCQVGDRFLDVRGNLREYRIHLGSSNILMKPHDEYLCIVPDGRATRDPGARVQLPFEGDRTLSIILSKAFLLAADDKIDDPTILSQLRVR